MADDIRVKGLSDLQKFLDNLPVALERNVMRGALRAGMGVIKPVAQSNVRKVSGLLADGLKIGTRVRGRTVTARLRATGKHGFVAGWVEHGTAAHKIFAKIGGSLFLGGIFSKSVNHPGAKPKPFMRPALDAQAQNAVIATGQYIKQRLATKNGLDTTYVLVEGDEA